MNAIAPERRYYPALDGLRGIAILMVVIFHNFGFINYFFFGWLGVDLFFVLSGLLITEILLKTCNKPNYLRNFFLRRILRIFPLYYLLLVICLIILPLLPSLKDSMQYYTTHQWWFWLYLQNWLYILHPPERDNLLLHLWSVAVEEQFYLIWPFAILFIKNRKVLLSIVITLLIAIMATRSLLWITNTEGLQYFNLYIFTRIDGICLGCALALIRNIKPDFIQKYTALLVSFFAALNFFFFFVNRVHDFSFPYYPFIGYTTFAILFTILVNECASGNKGWITVIFSSSILRFFGKISYGFYIIHWPIYKLTNEKFKEYLSNTAIGNNISTMVLSAFLATCLAFALSVLSFYFFENRFLHLKNRFTS
jgi:peptidoglycan/LPS O-acetylase OafA/YrhL